MIPHYGKRAPGALTAASPGDTLYFAFASYNDSGDSEALTGLAVSDIEVFKNGGATARATDSGYSLISDTGQVGDRVGLYRFSIQLFNTSDDTGHYDDGGWYQVAVDSVTIDGKTVRAWIGSFEIGTPVANVTEIGGDTGAATHLGALADEHDTGRLQADASSDTGAIATAVWAKSARTLTANTNLSGLDVNVTSFADTGVNNRLAEILADTDTGIIGTFTFTTAGIVDANIEYVNATQIQGTGDTGTNDTWRPV